MLCSKAQVTVFIVIGIAALFLLGLSIYALRLIQPDAKQADGLSKEVKNYLQSCQAEMLKSSISLVSAQGGYAELNDTYYYNDFFKVPIYGNLPDQATVAAEIDIVMDKFFWECLENASAAFASRGINLTYGKYGSSTEISLGEVANDIVPNIQIRSTGSTITLSRLHSEVPSSLGKIVSILPEMQAEFNLHPEGVCVSCLEDLGRRHEYGFEYLPEDNYFLITIKTANDEDPANNFAFAWERLGTRPAEEGMHSAVFSIIPLKDQEVLVGEPLFLAVKTTQRAVSISTDMRQLAVSEGIISFTPQTSDVGDYEILVTAVSQDGDEAYDSFILSVREKAEEFMFRSIPNLEAKAGSVFAFTIPIINPENIPIRYVIISDIFNNISDTNHIEFTPKAGDAGVHLMSLTAVSSRGVEATKDFYLEVKDG